MNKENLPVRNTHKRKIITIVLVASALLAINVALYYRFETGTRERAVWYPVHSELSSLTIQLAPELSKVRSTSELLNKGWQRAEGGLKSPDGSLLAEVTGERLDQVLGSRLYAQGRLVNSAGDHVDKLVSKLGYPSAVAQTVSGAILTYYLADTATGPTLRVYCEGEHWSRLRTRYFATTPGAL